jgi:uncharacterized membrane protein YhaH (DUF805 family)
MTNLPAPSKKRFELKPSDLWSAGGTLTRAQYLTLGSSLFGIKYMLDTMVAELVFHRHWSFLSYLFPGQSLDFILLNSADKAFYLTIMAMALPFIWTGIVLTIRRLRAAGLPVFLVYLFFVPFVNLLLFVMLSVIPTQTKLTTAGLPATTTDAADPIPPIPKWPKPDRSTPQKEQKQLVRTQNREKRADLVYALVTTCSPALALAWLGIFALQAFGWGLFVGLPFSLGMASAYLYGRREVRSVTESITVGLLAITLVGFGMFFFAWEGMACLVMASPIVYTLAAMGATVGYFMQKNKLRAIDQKMIMVALLFSMPTLMGAEYAAQPAPSTFPVTSVVEIAAPPSVVWRHVIAFPDLGPPDEWFFNLGIAYPIGATISGEGPGAVRKCNFSTGAFIEPIKVWDEPRLLQFGVEAQPPTMRELSWMHDIHPAHLQGYLHVDGGQFELQEIKDPAGGLTHTRLVGTTWYQNKMWPAPYWRLWSDEIIHKIHLRVLKHIRKNAEKEMAVTSHG